MGFLEIALTSAIARKVGKPPFFFSRFNFRCMQERGNTHYCFHCGGHVGFKLGENGELLDHIEDDGYDPMERHNEKHANAVIQHAMEYRNVSEWLKQIPPNFPYVVSVPSTFC